MSFLDPATVCLEQQSDKPPTLILDGDRYMNIKIRQAFPLTAEEAYVAFFDSTDNYLGMIKNPDHLDPDSLQIIKSDLNWRYFTPVIRRIIEIQNRGARALFVTETDRGKVNISMKDLRDSMVEISPDRILITDEFSNRYEIPNVRRLDRHSQKLIRRLI